MILYVVHGTIGGFAREDAPVSSVVGVYTDPNVAAKVKIAVGVANVSTVTLDEIKPGHLAFINSIFGKL